MMSFRRYSRTNVHTRQLQNVNATRARIGTSRRKVRCISQHYLRCPQIQITDRSPLDFLAILEAPLDRPPRTQYVDSLAAFRRASEKASWSGFAAGIDRTSTPMLVTNFKLKYVIYKIVCAFHQLGDVGRIHPMRERSLRALQRTTDYIERAMPDAVGFEAPAEVLAFALEMVKIEGHYLEFGVFTGGTIR